ncbi:glycine cleavage system protein GcvH [Photobacterium profundum]|uniref:Glycine cleavage system H protein n=1 Tax=Photobacterium profundum (strain SS9) TaxID=298386 RepID=Q6LMP6_PHOPR|nr:glycine cleavage system protein GcvH [Photobacterium profundum]CAG21431.1 putative glycine cleavage complex protein H [Photobacterium profundum SS9]
MSYVPSELRFSNTHEWVRSEGDGIYTVGITDHAQALLGDMVFIDVPDVDSDTEVGEDCAVAESVKAASDIYAPLTGVVVAVNEELSDSPERVNSDPYGDGWLFQIKAEDEGEFDDLLDPEGYQDLIDETE